MIDKIHKLRNTKISLEESSHTYILDDHPDLEFNNVTGIVEDQFPPFEREKVAKFLVNRSPKYQHLTWEELLQEWKDTRNHGSAVHKELEDYIAHEKNPSLAKAISGKNCYDNEIKNFGDKIFPELIVYSKELKVAGTIDLMVYNSDSNECYIFDWKTSKKIDRTGRKRALTSACSGLTDCSFDKYSLQLSMYSYLLEKYHDITVKNHFIVHLMKGDYNIITGNSLGLNVRLIFNSDEFAKFQKRKQKEDAFEPSISQFQKNMGATYSSTNSGCFIATAVYDSYTHPKVMVLRGYRDNVLVSSYFGRKFIEKYYKYSPRFVELIRKNIIIKRFIKFFLDSIVYLLKKNEKY